MKDVLNDFDLKDHKEVQLELSSITLDHVMANSNDNLHKTRAAVLQLSRGDLNELKRLVSSAREDFRNVIYWASLDNG